MTKWLGFTHWFAATPWYISVYSSFKAIFYLIWFFKITFNHVKADPYRFHAFPVVSPERMEELSVVLISQPQQQWFPWAAAFSLSLIHDHIGAFNSVRALKRLFVCFYSSLVYFKNTWHETENKMKIYLFGNFIVSSKETEFLFQLKLKRFLVYLFFRSYH